MPKRDVTGVVGVSFCRSVKYENSSVDLQVFEDLALSKVTF